MYKEKRITISSRDNPVLNHRYLKQESPSNTLVVVFPGLGYSCDMPLLHYCTKAALQMGCDVIHLEYFFHRSQNAYTSGDEPRVVSDCCAAVKTALSKADTYENTVFLSKSMGTVFAGKTALVLPDATVKHFFLTPLPETLPFIETAKCAAVVGGSDPYFPKECVCKLTALSLPTSHLFPGMDHSLESPGSYTKSLMVLGEVTGLWAVFLQAI